MYRTSEHTNKIMKKRTKKQRNDKEMHKHLHSKTLHHHNVTVKGMIRKSSIQARSSLHPYLTNHNIFFVALQSFDEGNSTKASFFLLVQLAMAVNVLHCILFLRSIYQPSLFVFILGVVLLASFSLSNEKNFHFSPFWVMRTKASFSWRPRMVEFPVTWP